MGRKEHQPTPEGRELVKVHTAIGTRQETIAAILGINKSTLLKYYRHEIDHGKEMADGEVGGALFNKAINGDTTAAIWWTKSRMGWKEKVQLEQNVTITDTGADAFTSRISGLIARSGEGSADKKPH